jgi:SAM-dependent methyltransferase
MEQYIVDLFVTSAREQVCAPAWLLRLYLSIFSPPLGKTLRLDMVKSLLSNQHLEGKRVLDVGCGIGDLSFILSAHGAQVTGIELDPQKVARASSIAQRWHFERLRFLVGDVRKLDQMNLGQFDAIFCIALLEHVQDDVTLLRQLQAMLRPGGIFVLEVPSALRKTIAEVEAADGHVRAGYIFEDVPALLEHAGFSVKKRCSMDPLGLTYYWFVCSRLIPIRIVQRWLFAALGPLFIALIRLTSALIKRPGYELCFLAVKE